MSGSGEADAGGKTGSANCERRGGTAVGEAGSPERRRRARSMSGRQRRSRGGLVGESAALCAMKAGGQARDSSGSCVVEQHAALAW
jgi:hypothetical protein